MLKLKAVEVKSEAIYGISGPENPQVLILEAAYSFRGCEAVASMASEVKTGARFELSGPDLPQVPILEAAEATASMASELEGKMTKSRARDAKKCLEERTNP